MIRRQRNVNLANDKTHQIQSQNDSIKEGLPTTCMPSELTCNGRSNLRKQNDRFRRRRKKEPSNKTCRFSWLWIVVDVGSSCCFSIVFYNLIAYSQTRQLLQTPVKSNVAVIFPPQRFRAPPRKLAVPIIRPSSAHDNERDFGNLELRFPEYETFRRFVYHDTNEDAGYFKLWKDADDDGDMESYYAFDDDDKRNPLIKYDDPDIHLKKKCRRTNWHRQLPITCNTIHKYDFQSHIRRGETKFLGYVE